MTLQSGIDLGAALAVVLMGLVLLRTLALPLVLGLFPERH